MNEWILALIFIHSYIHSYNTNIYNTHAIVLNDMFILDFWKLSYTNKQRWLFWMFILLLKTESPLPSTTTSNRSTAENLTPHTNGSSTTQQQQQHPLVPLESPYVLLHHLSADPLLLSVVSHLCVREYYFVTGMQLSLVRTKVVGFFPLSFPISWLFFCVHCFSSMTLSGWIVLLGFRSSSIHGIAPIPFVLLVCSGWFNGSVRFGRPPPNK